jgi:hypothetical protein
MPEPMPQWIVENLNDIVDGEFDCLPKDIQAKFMRLAFSKAIRQNAARRNCSCA